MILASSLSGDKELVVMKNNKITSLPNNEWPSRPKFALIAPGRCTLGPQDFISSSYLLAHNFCGYLLISGSFYWDDLRKNVCSVTEWVLEMIKYKFTCSCCQKSGYSSKSRIWFACVQSHGLFLSFIDVVSGHNLVVLVLMGFGLAFRNSVVVDLGWAGVLGHGCCCCRSYQLGRCRSRGFGCCPGFSKCCCPWL